MKKALTIGLAFALVATAGVLMAQDHPEHPKKKDPAKKTETQKPEHPSEHPNEHPDSPPMPIPTEEHAWLNKLVGEWEYTGSFTMGEESQPLVGTESARSLGGWWLIAEIVSTDQLMPFTGISTLGYDATKGQYFGTWVMSMDGTMMHYTGKVENDGKTLTLNTKGPNMETGEGEVNMKDVYTIVDADHKTLTSFFQNPDGSWTQMMTLTYTRKK